MIDEWPPGYFDELRGTSEIERPTQPPLDPAPELMLGTPSQSLHCISCRRPLWDGGHALNEEECSSPGDEVCHLWRTTHKLHALLERALVFVPAYNHTLRNDIEEALRKP